MSSTQGRRPGRSPRAERSREAVDRQTLMLRRSAGLGAAVVVVILLVIGINGCLDSRKERAFEDYAKDVRALVGGSSEISDRLFILLSRPSRSDALDVQTQVNAERAEAEQLVARARGTDHPNELNDANGWLVEVLEFRADAIRGIAEQLPAALGDERDSRDAINSIAGQMQAFLASDVIYLRRTIPELTDAYDEQGLDGGSRPTGACPTSAGSTLTASRRSSAVCRAGRARPRRRGSTARASGRNRAAVRAGADRQRREQGARGRSDDIRHNGPEPG